MILFNNIYFFGFIVFLDGNKQEDFIPPKWEKADLSTLPLEKKYRASSNDKETWWLHLVLSRVGGEYGNTEQEILDYLNEPPEKLESVVNQQDCYGQSALEVAAESLVPISIFEKIKVCSSEKNIEKAREIIIDKSKYFLSVQKERKEEPEARTETLKKLNGLRAALELPSIQADEQLKTSWGVDRTVSPSSTSISSAPSSSSAGSYRLASPVYDKSRKDHAVHSGQSSHSGLVDYMESGGVSFC